MERRLFSADRIEYAANREGLKGCMKEPDVITETHDLKNNFTFRVRAYRKLSAKEMRKALFVWSCQGDKKRSLKNETVTVTSIIGYKE